MVHGKTKKPNKITVLFDDNEDGENESTDLLQAPKRPSSTVSNGFKSRTTFKKIKKETALKIKQVDDNSIVVKKELDETFDPSLVKKEGEVVDLKPNFENLFPKPLKNERLSQLAEQERSSVKTEDNDTPLIPSSEDEDDLKNDRAWYTQDEESTHTYFDDDDYFMADEENLIAAKKKATLKAGRNSSRQKSESKWFNSRMAHATGSSASGDISDDDLDEVSKDIDILVHRLTPPFLDAETIMSDRLEVIDVIKDKTGDLYKYSKNGSHLVNERRLNRDTKKNAEEAAEISGTKLGKVLGQSNDSTSEPEEGNKSESLADALNEENKSSKFSQNLSLKEQRQFLPAFKCRNDLLKVINENQVIVVIGETGSGKTTQIAQYLYEEGYHNRGLIGVTQPRRVAAVSVAKRVSEEMEVALGQEVGFTIRFEDHTSSKTKIKFMTDGILLRESLVDSELGKYSCIIMDEAHERSLNTDILLGLFKKILMRRRDLKLIVTSATMNADRFSKFFGNAEQFTIPGRTFPVDVLFSTVPSVDYVASAVKQVLRIHLANETGDILCFMTGQEDIETTCEEIEKELDSLMKLDSAIKPISVLPVYSTLPADLQSKIFKKSKIRKCIVATNIAETSLTVDGVMYVIDTGLMKLKVYNPKLGMDSLQITPISLAQANQRSGRAGRTGPGTCYRMYTQTASVNEMFVQPIPEIQRTNLSHTVLLLKSLNISDLAKFPFLDRPPVETINTAQYDLWSLGALDNWGKLTELGKKMSNFPIDPPLSRLLIISTLPQFQCSREMIVIVAMLSVPPIFVRPTNDINLQKRSDSIREKFQVAESDHLTLLNLYNQFKASGSRESWCKQNFLQYKSLKRAKEIQSQLVEIMSMENLMSNPDWDSIRKCIGVSFFHQAAQFKKYGEYMNLRSGLRMQLHPTSALYGMGDLPKFVVYHEVLLTGKEYMNCVTAVQGSWLVEFGGIFYSEKIKGLTVKENQQSREKEFQKVLDTEREKTTEGFKTETNTAEEVDKVKGGVKSLIKRRRLGGRF